jgi:hypothetical protein
MEPEDARFAARFLRILFLRIMIWHIMIWRIMIWHIMVRSDKVWHERRLARTAFARESLFVGPGWPSI